MATYRSLAEREAAENAEQQRIQSMQTQPADPTFAGAAPPTPAAPAPNPDPAAPAPTAPNPGNAPPWLSNQPAPGSEFNGRAPSWLSPTSVPGTMSNSSSSPQSSGMTPDQWQPQGRPTYSPRPLSGGLQAASNPGGETSIDNSASWQSGGYMDAGMHGDSPASMGMQGMTRPMAAPMTSGANDPRMAAPQGPNPGVEVAQQQAWEGGPGVTLTRSSNTDLPNLATGLNTSGLPQLQTGLNTGALNPIDTDFSGQAQRGADAAYRGATQFFDEDFGRDRAALENQLVNQGLQPGSEAFNTQMGLMLRGQNQARENAGFMAQGVGHQQAGDLLARALQARQQGVAEQGQNAQMGLAARGALTGEQEQSAGMSLAARTALSGERERDADRLHGQSMDVANLGLGARGQSLGRDTALQGNATAAAAAANAANNARYGIDTNRDLSLRQLGLSQDNQDFQQLMALLTQSRGGVNMPNFGAPQPLDVGNANSIASNNANAQQNRDAADRSALYGLGAAGLGALGRTYFNGY